MGDIETEEKIDEPPTRTRRIIGAILLLLIAVFASVSLVQKSLEDQKIQLGLTNLRRLGIAFQLYAQDWDGRPTPISGSAGNWTQALAAYIEPENLENPLNPLLPHTVHPRTKEPIPAGYALNYRFWDTFGKGAFLLENLEIPAQTALFVEAGSAWADALSPNSDKKPLALTTYTDTTEKVEGYTPFPSARSGKSAVVAADGHIVVVKVAYYAPSPLHNALYGRFGGNIYNWNGGFENGKTDTKPKD